MSATRTETAPPLDDVMMAMDVVDTLRHRQDLVLRELDGTNREAQLIARLREVYHQQGIEVPDHILKQGVDALAESRFVYTPPQGGFGVWLARLYVSRARWGKYVLGLALVLILALGAYFLAYLPYQSSRAEAARIELSETLPAQMQALYDTIYEETRVQAAVTQAEALLQRGQTAAAEGDRDAAVAAVEGLTGIRDTLRQEYTLRIVNREGVQSGFWTFPEVNTEATNYYVVVEAVTADNETLSLPILNEENDEIELVDIWGVRVPEQVYRSVEADKLDDGIIQRNVVGRKQSGFLEVDYVVPVLGGAVTRW